MKKGENMKQLTKTKMLCSMLIGAGLIASVGAFAMNNVSTSSATADTADTARPETDFDTA